MTDSLANALPFPSASDNHRKKAAEAANETTPGGHEPVAWVVAAINLAPVEAMIIKGRLESFNIPAVVQQESIGSVMGLTVGPLGSAKILVPEPLAENAMTLLAQTYEAGDRLGAAGDDGDEV